MNQARSGSLRTEELSKSVDSVVSLGISYRSRMDFVWILWLMAPGPSCSISKIRRIRLSGALTVLTIFDHWPAKPPKHTHKGTIWGYSWYLHELEIFNLCHAMYYHACDAFGGSNWWWASSNRRSCQPSLRKKWPVSRRRMSAGSRGADGADGADADGANDKTIRERSREIPTPWNSQENSILATQHFKGVRV